jgi:UDP-N-acetylglucosamine--N-acetylmuramyl-(pentapeptide) pyrophosphoryl-undecaprenol N-acetylglucosamine transferase
VVPALAVAGELRRRGHEALFIGTKRGMEAQLAPRAGFPIEWIEIGGLQGVGLGRALLTLSQLPSSVLRSRAILRRRGAAAVFSMGGYVAAPVMVAAALGGTPMVLMEPNAVPGLVARRMSRYVRRALVAFEEARPYFPAGRSEVCGLPVRKEFFEVGERDANAVFTVLLTGGSRGSRSLNRIARECWPVLKRTLPALRWIHQSGSREFETMGRAFSESGLDGYVTPFIENMAGAYAGADLIVGRSGAGSIAEIAAAGRAAVLVPFPFATDDHQRQNAEALARVGAAIVLTEDGLTVERFCDAIAALAQDPERRQRMGRSARSMARAGTAERAADVLQEVAAGGVDAGRERPKQ